MLCLVEGFEKEFRKEKGKSMKQGEMWVYFCVCCFCVLRVDVVDVSWILSSVDAYLKFKLPIHLYWLTLENLTSNK